MKESQELITSNLPNLSTLEMRVIDAMADSLSKKAVSDSLGLPVTVVTNILRKKGVKEYLQELKEAKREMLLSYSIDVIAKTLQERVAAIEEDEERSLASSTRKDHIDLAMKLSELLKASTSDAQKSDDPLAKIYQQINIINKGDADAN